LALNQRSDVTSIGSRAEACLNVLSNTAVNKSHFRIPRGEPEVLSECDDSDADKRV